jgi:uncharacterized membrane protein YphA (DoxX/SURF4 family)
MMKMLLFISRIIAGSVLVVSGLVKANDTLGFSYKMEEYFSAEVLNMEFLIPFALSFAVLMCIAEIVLGFALIIGAEIKISSWLALLLTIFFAFLTFYSAYFDKVNDCGCFGDAIKFTPWQSFTKDIVLMLFILPVFIHRKDVHLNTEKEDRSYFLAALIFIGLFSFVLLDWGFPFYFSLLFFVLTFVIKKLSKGRATSWILASLSIFMALIFSYYTFSHLPIKDYRPYAVGKNIAEQREVPEGVQADVYATTFVYKNAETGEEKEFDQSNYPWNDSTWVWVSTDNVLVTKGYEPPVHDFVITDADGYELQEDILAEEEPVVLVICYDIEKANTSEIKKVNAFVNDAEANGLYVYGLSASLYDQIEDFKLENQVPVTFYSADETMLKTVIRSNPGVVVLKKGDVIAKWHYNDLPSYSEFAKTLN